MENFGLAYNKNFYKFNLKTNQQIPINEYNDLMSKLNKEIYDKNNHHLLEFQIPTKESLPIKNDNPNIQSINLKTTYPGLLVGAGNPHPVFKKDHTSDQKNSDKDFSFFQLGFSMDYTTGLPIITGSSLKGALRSVFFSNEKNEKIRQGKLEDIQTILKNIKNIKVFQTIAEDEKMICKLEKHLFEGLDFQEKPKSLSLYQRDLFLDSFVTSKNTKIFGEDYITHHPSPIQNPIPIKFMRILPNIEFEFRFVLSNYEDNTYTITSADKKVLFETIMKSIGFALGARKNVGYGNLVNP